MFMKKPLLGFVLFLTACTTQLSPENPSFTNKEWIEGTIKSALKEGLELTEWDSAEPCQEEIADSDLSNIHPQQITACYSLTDLTIAFVTQPNTWTALEEVREWEAEGNTAWSGLVAKPIKGEWELLFQIPDEDFNPLALYSTEEGLFLDAVDDSGAGSGEGTLQRYAYLVSGVTDENLYTWQKEACTSYYIPETYTDETACVEPTLFNDATKETVPSDWAMLDQGDFTLYAPAGWTHTSEQGIDSAVGNFSGDGIILRYDYGNYSGFLDNGTEDAYDVTEETINGFEAKIATPKTTGEGRTVLFFENIRETARFSMSADDLNTEQEALALQIFHTIQFKQ